MHEYFMSRSTYITETLIFIEEIATSGLRRNCDSHREVVHAESPNFYQNSSQITQNNTFTASIND
jgi:hypothetical protein